MFIPTLAILGESGQKLQPEPGGVLPKPRLQLVPGDPRAAVILGRLPLQVEVVVVDVDQNRFSGSRRGTVRVLGPETVDPEKRLRLALVVDRDHSKSVLLV